MAQQKKQKKTLKTKTLAQKAADSKMPAVLYKATYDTKTGLWNTVWISHDFEKSSGLQYNHSKYSQDFWLKNLHPDDTERVTKKLEQLQNGADQSMELTYRLLHKDGTYHWFIDSAILFKDAQQKPAEIVGSWVDISAYHEAEGVIKENEEHYKKIAELSPHAVFVHNSGIFRFLNNAAIKLFGAKKSEDIIGKSIFDFIHPDFHEQKRTRMFDMLGKKRTLPPIEYKIITLDGSIKDVEIASTQFTFSGIPSAQDVVIDITKFKQAEEAYRANATELEHLNKILMKRELEQAVRGEKNCSASFDPSASVLHIGSTDIHIQKFSKQYYLLEIIFKDTTSETKDWQLSEISELIDSEALFNWKKFYNIADAIRKNVAIETGIKDFFILTTQSVKINPHYLKKS